MAQIPNTGEASFGDGLNTYVNIDTQNKVVQLLNGATLKFYSDGGATQTGALSGAASASAPDPGANGTVATSGVGRARVSPAANRTGCILAAGAFDGQEVWVVNEASSNTISWATAATSNIGGESGGTFVLAAKGAQKFVWDANDSLWHKAA